MYIGLLGLADLKSLGLVKLKHMIKHSNTSIETSNKKKTDYYWLLKNKEKAFAQTMFFFSRESFKIRKFSVGL